MVKGTSEGATQVALMSVLQKQAKAEEERHETPHAHNRQGIATTSMAQVTNVCNQPDAATSPGVARKTQEDSDSESMDAFPAIVDCGPDQEDR
jgi:hypothetical protein